jgi:hypothetical protein
MTDNEWEQKLRDFVKKTGADFKRAGQDIQVETKRLLAQVRDPETQTRVRATLREVGQWAKKTGDELTALVDQGVKKAEVVIIKAQDRVRDLGAAEPQRAGQAPSVPSAAPTVAPEDPPVRPARKTVGRAAAGAAKTSTRKAPGAASRPARKTVGKKRPPPSGA